MNKEELKVNLSNKDYKLLKEISAVEHTEINKELNMLLSASIQTYYKSLPQQTVKGKTMLINRRGGAQVRVKGK